MVQEDYKPKALLPMPAYERLMVKAVESNKKDGTVVAFINGQLAYFDKKRSTPKAGETVEVMIQAPLYVFDTKNDCHRLKAVFITPVTDEFVEIDHNGFECSGSMCRTTATTIAINDKAAREKSDRCPWLTPGRTDVFAASNVNAGYAWKQPYQPRRPGKAYVLRKEIEAGEFPLRIQGLRRIEDTMYAHLAKKGSQA